MTPTKAALEALNNLVTPYDSNDELGLQMYGHYLHEHKDTIKQALTANTSDALVNELIDLLHIMWDGYENGDPCYENLDGEQGGFMGNAFQICDDKETRICEILNHHRPVKPKPDQPPC